MDNCVMLGHGSGGTMMKRIIEEVFFDAYGGAELLSGDDAAVLSLTPLSLSTVPVNNDHDIATLHQKAPTNMPNSLAFSTDSFVVTPQFFPGGDIGRLAVCGTVNDVATSGATPLYLSCGFILEEGFAIDDLRRICASMATAAQEAGVRIVTGDTKVVNKGLVDGVFINTAGVGLVPAGLRLSGTNCRPGDKVLVSGTLGDHGITIMSCRESLSFTTNLESDAAPLNHLIHSVLEATGSFEAAKSLESSEAGDLQEAVACRVPVRCFRDPTRGGLASTLNELAGQSGVDIVVNEEAIPVKDAVRGACDMLGYDALQVANEGKMVCVVAPDAAEVALEAMRANPYGREAAIIGEVVEAASIKALSADVTTDNFRDPRDLRDPKVYVRNAFGGRRILDMLVGEQLPRIC